MILDKLSALEIRDAEQRSLNKELQQHISSQQNEIQNLKMQLSSQQKTIEKQERNGLSADEQASNSVTIVQQNINYPNPEVRGKLLFSKSKGTSALCSSNLILKET